MPFIFRLSFQFDFAFFKSNFEVPMLILKTHIFRMFFNVHFPQKNNRIHLSVFVKLFPQHRICLISNQRK
jgi:hypothetical protein